MKFNCAYCGEETDRPTGHVNRSRAQGLNLYCGKKCSGLARRKPPKTVAQKRAEKAAYDREYRRKNRTLLKAKKAAYHCATYDPAAARIERKKRAAFHAEYCRRPSYKLWKQEYDRRHRAQQYGPFADAYQLTIELNREIKARSSNYEIRQANQTGNKTQKRDRLSEGPKRSRGDSAAYCQ
jgi:hypothetical protein